MTVGSKRGERELLRPLDEKEIQRRLYGRYHRDVNEPTTAPQSGSVLLEPAVEPDQDQTPLPSNKEKPLQQGISLLAGVAKKFPWNMIWIATGFFVALMAVLQFLFLSIGKEKAVSPEPAASVRLRVAGLSRVSGTAAQSKPLSPSTIVQAIPPSARRESGTVAEKKKYYAVQVCTYQREPDARQLARELRSLHFPAFYLRIPSRHGRVLHYVVFLSREDTFAQASTKLDEFRKTRDFQRFPDSFIRSI